MAVLAVPPNESYVSVYASMHKYIYKVVSTLIVYVYMHVYNESMSLPGAALLIWNPEMAHVVNVDRPVRQ